ncbi:hypothetical protein GCM10023187_21000 [Nibrella viscosa]|uniref:Protein kinase domain-containing protein n=1 Tax=Nibrella viscosa TaxID=1084524 RepID=A0ABP8KDG6_9BACT
MSPVHPLLHQVVADYRLTEYLGAGGMGEVFKAVHQASGQPAAVKVLYRPEFAARFRNEAYVQASVSHPHIAALYEYSLLDNRPALIMELVEGRPLDELLRKRERFGNAETIRIFGQIAGAVAYLHQQGIIHRDIKPSNVRIRPDGQAKLLDFGISKGKFTPQLTQAGHIVGTSEYMAPEQFRHQVALTSDVWSLGVLLYELTTGHLPFDDKNPLMLRRQIERGQYTPPRLLNPALAPHLADLITACLQPNPARRPTATGLVRALTPGQPVERLRTLTQEAQQWVRSGQNTFGLILAGAILLSTGLWFWFGSPAQPEPPEPEVLVKPTRYEQIQVEVVNADYDVQLVLPDGSVQNKEPFVVNRIPGEALPITIRHQGVERQFVIDPGVNHLYQCYFDK